MALDNESPHDAQVKYFPVAPVKYVLMSICTLGIYDIYWHYKNWKTVKVRDESRILPLARAIFYPFWFYSLLTDIAKHSGRGALSAWAYRAVLAIAVIVLSAVSRLPDPYWLLSFLTFVPALPAIIAIDRENAAAGVTMPPAFGYRPVNFVAFLLGGPIVVFLVLQAAGMIPGTAVVPGSALTERQLEFLLEEEILGEGEEIIYFYSEGLYSIKEGGQFISADYVTSYWFDPEDDELYSAFAAYEDIQRFDIDWTDSALEDTIVTVRLDDGDYFSLWLSGEESGDKRFVTEMKRNWRLRRDNFMVPREATNPDLSLVD